MLPHQQLQSNFPFLANLLWLLLLDLCSTFRSDLTKFHHLYIKNHITLSKLSFGVTFRACLGQSSLWQQATHKTTPCCSNPQPQALGFCQVVQSKRNDLDI